jgi:dephospho-CoA kinase
MQGPGGALIPAIEQAFPGSTNAGGVDREALGAQVFADPDARGRLEAIVHPAVAAKRAAFIEENAGADLILFDIPLLFEGGGHAMVDHIVVVSAPEEMQRERVMAREGMTEEKFQHILKIQVPDADKRARADHIIDTGVSLDATRQSVLSLIDELRAEMA